MQKAYINALSELAAEDARVVSILADNGTDYDWLFQRDYPRQFLNVGIAEQNMVALGAGLSTCGYVPFMLTAGAFLAYRAYEFIRDDVCLPRRNVKLIASGSGLSIANLGPTHHTTEDLACLRPLPNLTILTPASPSQVGLAVREARRIDGPVYIRMGMSGEKELFDDQPAAYPYRACCLREGAHAAILAVGSMAEEGLIAAELLKAQGVDAAVYAFASMNPFDGETVRRLAKNVRLLVTAEEHSVTGGLGSACAEALAELPAHAPLARIGLEGRFAQGYGVLKQMRSMNGLDGASIATRVLDAWRKLP